MGRHQENPVRKYFTYDAGNKRSVCKVEDCLMIIKGNHEGNMQRHIHSCHKVLYDQIFGSTSKQHANTSESDVLIPNKSICLHK